MATIIRPVRTISFAAVDATVLDGTTAGQTYQSYDRLASACVVLDEETDAVIIYISGTGSANNTVLFHIYGYGDGSDAVAERIYYNVTATLGTAITTTGQLYADTITGTDFHTSTVGVFDSGNNTVCKIKIDTQGLKHLYFEPVTFTTLTAIKFHIREVGQK